MNWDQVEGKMKQWMGSAKERWGKLTDDELQQIGGKRDQMIGKLQEKYGWTREQGREGFRRVAERLGQSRYTHAHIRRALRRGSGGPPAVPRASTGPPACDFTHSP